MAEVEIINIVKDYAWTLAPKDAREGAPRILATSYEVTSNQIFNAMKFYQEATFSDDGISYYEKLHDGATAKNFWVIPFFSDEVRSFRNEWGDTYVGSTNGTQAYGAQKLGELKQAADRAAGSVGQGGAAVFGKPGALFEPPKFYTYGTSDNSATVEFTLINTSSLNQDRSKNYSLVKQLITDNRFNRGSSTIATPPYLWSVTIPGYRFIRWASCDVSVNMLGRRELINNILMPEGYRIALTFTSLYTEPNNFASLY